MRNLYTVVIFCLVINTAIASENYLETQEILVIQDIPLDEVKVTPEPIKSPEMKMSYVSIEGGAAFYDRFNQLDYNHKRPKDGIIFGVGIGRNINEFIAVEAKALRFNDFEFDEITSPTIQLRLKQKFSAMNFAVNLKVSMPTAFFGVRPFANIGGGYALIEAGNVSETSTLLSTNKEGKNKGNLSYNLGAGVNVPFVDWLSGNLSYQFFELGKSSTSAVTYDGSTPDFNRAFETTIRAHTVMAALQYHF